MSTSRSASFRFTAKGVCHWCGNAVPKGRRSWCSAACVEEYLIRSQPSHARRRVKARDHGICAKCGRDCDSLGKRLAEKIRQRNHSDSALRARGMRWWHLAVRLGLSSGYGYVARSLWEADHILPVVEGGGGCGLDNLRTLCLPCHKSETRALAARRAAARRAALEAAAPQQPLPLEVARG